MLGFLKRSLWKSLGITAYIIQYGCIAHFTLEFIGDFVVCKGPSMEPTVNSEDIILTEHISPRMKTISRNDVVIARSPVDPQKFICKRVFALPGDRINKGLWTEVVPPGYVWLQGDNEENSTDSRSFGPIPQGLIRGKAIFRIWPLSKFGLLENK